MSNRNGVQGDADVSGFNPLAEAFEHAGQMRQKGGTTLPKISDVTELSADELAAAAHAAQKRKEWAEKVGPQLINLDRGVREILATPNWEFSELLVSQKNRFEQERGKLLSFLNRPENAELRKHVSFSRLVATIRSLTGDQESLELVERSVIPELLATGRYTALSSADVHRWRSAHAGKLPRGAFRFNGKVYFPYQPQDGQEKSSAQHLLEHELVKARRRLPDEREAKRRKLKELPGIRLNEGEAFLQRSVGVYGFDIPARKVRGRKLPGGFVVVRVAPVRKGASFYVIRPVDGTGRASYVGKEAGKGWYLTSLSPRKVSENEHLPREAELLARDLNDALAPVYAERKKLEELAAECGECDE